MKKRRGRPPGSKNKPRNVTAPPPDIDEVIITGATLTEAYLTAKEHADHELAIQLRKEGKITTTGAPFELSDEKEIETLIGKGVFQFEQFKPEKHGGMRIFRSRMVHEIKGKGVIPYEKSRLVIQGHGDREKEMVLTQSPTIQRASQRIVMALAPTLIKEKGMAIWLRDITQAYTQSATSLQRTILARLPSQIAYRYPLGTIMTVMKPLYGIAEAGTH